MSGDVDDENKKREALKKKFKPPKLSESWARIKASVGGNPYLSRTVEYAEEWAFLMEESMAFEGKPVADVAKAASREADYDGITGNMYGVAAALLASEWEHGEALRLWHNAKYGEQGLAANRVAGAVINPAIITISAPEGQS